MNLGERIERRRIEVGLSQAELARRVGVRQSTMNSLIRGNSQTSRSLTKIARELQTTPEYLTGETDDPSPDASDLACSAEEREWLNLLHDLNSKERYAVRQLMIALASASLVANSPSQSVHSPQLQYRGQG